MKDISNIKNYTNLYIATQLLLVMEKQPDRVRVAKPKQLDG